MKRATNHRVLQLLFVPDKASNRKLLLLRSRHRPELINTAGRVDQLEAFTPHKVLAIHLLIALDQAAGLGTAA